MMFKKILLAAVLIPFSLHSTAKKQLEKLNRGVVAVKTDDQSAFISWRILETDPDNIAFDLWRSCENTPPVKMNPTPIDKGTNWIDNGLKKNQAYTYFVQPSGEKPSIKASNKYILKGNQPIGQYLSIPLQTPERYTPNDCSVADLNGDGSYEIIVQMTGVGRDNSHAGLTSPAIFHAYTLDGTLLWEINLGINIRDGAHYTQFLVYDFDGDGRAEFMCKTADGSRDGLGNILGDPKADWRVLPANGDTDPWAGRARMPRNRDGYRPQQTPPQQPDPNARYIGKIFEGPEYLTVFDGLTGKALATTDYVPERGARTSWGDDNGNRSERYLAGVAYLDGKHPSAVFARGYYTRAVLAAWDWRDGKLQQRWVFDSEDGTPGNAAYSGQGNHQISVADVDEDGFDEIIYGACVINHDGTGLYSTGKGHGDALHCSDLDPDRPGLEIFQVHENMRLASDVGAGHFRDAKTGELIWGLPAREDVGRGLAADIDPNHSGHECWSTASDGLYSAKGERISKRKPRSCNFAIWWDADSSRELLNSNYISKWDPNTEQENLLFRADSCVSNNGTKSNPAISADLFGDWREELMLRHENNKELRIFTTVIPTDLRRVTLMHDAQYRLAVAWQNVSYNQPPHPSKW
ncbi:MAG TPA: rhamnogalacturonan lyase [Bacteroidales bacterium]|jgi:rhamnogalacturonan endolyase|nr:rhamnogalacturonan lyase [Bacteroidales bacterium]